MKELVFKTEYQKIISARDKLREKLLTSISADLLNTCKHIIDKNENYLYGNVESGVIQYKCYNVVYNTLSILTGATQDVIKQIFDYVSLCDTVNILDEDNVKAYDNDDDEGTLIFVFEDGNAMYLSIYDYRLYDYAIPGKKENKLKVIMQNKGFTAAGLANVSGVSRRTIENYMSGHRNIANAKSEIVSALANALNVDVVDLFNK